MTADIQENGGLILLESTSYHIAQLLFEDLLVYLSGFLPLACILRIITALCLLLLLFR